MANHERDRRPLLLSERQKLRCKAAYHIAHESHIVCHPEGVEHREKQQWIFGRFSHRLSLFDQEARLLRSRFGFWRRMPFERYQWGYERDLKLDTFVTPGASGRQGRDL